MKMGTSSLKLSETQSDVGGEDECRARSRDDRQRNDVHVIQEF